MVYLLKIAHNLDSIDHSFIDNELNKIALENNAQYTNYDLETELNKNTKQLEIKNVVYEWILPDEVYLKKFVNALPLTYKINFIQRKNSNIDCYTIFKKASPPDIKKFTLEDKEIYIYILNRYKQKLNTKIEFI